jgi:GNAT superfamily N-acetyltransferase
MGSGVIVCERVRWPDRDTLHHVKKIYLASFSPEDRVPFILLTIGILVGRLQLAVARQQQVVGFALWATLPRPAQGTAYLAYLAVDEHQRNQGVGGQLFQTVVKGAVDMRSATLVWEVEVPEGERDDPRQRRVAFYMRQGGSISKFASRFAETTVTGETKPMRIMWRSLTDPLRVENRDEVIRWIQGIYRLAYRSRHTADEVQWLFMEPPPFGVIEDR